MSESHVKNLLYEQFARIGKALDSPRRVELLELLDQGERSVETLSRLTGMGLTNTSAHLQVLRQSRLVETRKDGTKVWYRLADEQVARFLGEFRELARARLTEIQHAMRTYFTADDDPVPVTRAELMHRVQNGDAIVVDVRPAEEYAAGHIPGALSVPFDELEHRIDSLPADIEIIAYCRGPYCVLAPQAVRLLRAHGVRARRLEDGFPEWRLAGLPTRRAG
jgi:rhodanese-related sulfurtransferase/DNA-binding transcriptional ArsR family regulator